MSGFEIFPFLFAGMRCYGAVRHGPDIRVRELYEECDEDEGPEEQQEPQAE